MSLRDYAWMLNDPARINAFRRAITAIVKPGDVVVEIGAGLGTFSFLACQAGASRVYAIEDNVFDALCEIVDKQTFCDRIKPIRGNSHNIKLPEKANVIIFEDFNSAFLGVGMNKFFDDSSRRFLLSGGKWLPSEAVICGALYEAPAKWEKLSAWRNENDHLGGLDFSPLAGWMLNSKFRDEYSPDGFISSPRDLRRYRLGGEAETYDLSWRGEDVSERRANVHGICVWFRLEFGDGIILDNAPGTDETVYQQVFFPLSAPVPVADGERVEWSLYCTPGGDGNEISWNWRVESQGGLAEGTTFADSPFLVANLIKNSENHVPILDSDLRMAKFILGEVDGKQTQGEIAVKLQKEFPNEIQGERKALQYVVYVLGN